MISPGQLYDSLFDFESAKTLEYYPIHKKLKSVNTEDELLDIILKEVRFSPNDIVLDAGCGTGNTLFKLTKYNQVSGLGISLSQKEIDFAEEYARKANLTHKVVFKKQSFEKPLESKFDKIIAIESIKHSNSIGKVINYLIEATNDGGIIVIADDFLLENSDLVEEHRKLWNVPGFCKLENTLKPFSANGNFNLRLIKLTHKVKVRPFFILQVIKFFTRFFYKITKGKFKTYCALYLGGILLEILYIKKKISYFVIIATKND